MSSNIDREIVQLVFEAKEFRKGIQESIEQITALKKSIDLSKAQESFGQLETASNMDFAPMAKSLAAINNKISLLGVAAAAMVTKVTNAVMDSAKKMWDALVMTPIKTGLEEYETQLNAVQTILANTAKHGTDLEDVTAALNELNLYADLTIYNFTQMTDSIGKFTTAGVTLETSVKAIKGIANVAALSGSNAQQASTAMYQMSQAISSGMVRLQDWMSIENAGMGGTIFQDSLLETARMHGIAVDAMVEKNGSFRYSLQEKWLTSEIMLETLEKFTGDMTAAQLVSLGYTEEQAIGILKTAELASDAATKVKTYTQLMETMNEALQSGWSQSWALIFGDFEEAKDMWGQVATVFGDMIADSANARNALLAFWKIAGGRTALIKSFFNIVKAITNIIGAFTDGITDIFKPIEALDLARASIAFMEFSKRLAEASENAWPLRRIARGLAAGIDILRLVFLAILKPIIEFVKTLSPAAASFLDTAVSIADAVAAFRKFAIETDFFNNIVSNLIAYVADLIDQAKELRDTFMELEIVQDITKWFKALERQDFIDLWNGILIVIKAILAPIALLVIVIKSLYSEVIKLEVVKKISEWFNAITWGGIKDAFREVADSIQELIDTVRDSDLLAKFLEYFETFDGRRFTQFFADAKANFSGFGDVIGKVTGKLGGLSEEADKTSEGVKTAGKSMSKELQKVLTTLTEGAKNIDYSAMFDMINTGMLAAFFLSIRKIFTGGLLGGLFGGGIDDLAEGLTDIVEGLGDTLGTFQNNIRADTLKKIAIALAILAGSIFLLTLIDSTKLATATGAMVLMVTLLFGSAGALGLIKPGDALKAAGVIIGLSIALNIAALALNNVSGLDENKIKTSLAAMAAGLVGLVVSVNAISSKSGGGLIKTVGTLLGLAVALRVLMGSILAFGKMDEDQLAQGLLAVGASIGILVTSLLVLGSIGDKSLLTGSIAIVDMAVALLFLSRSVMEFGEMDEGILAQGLEAVGAIFVGFGIFSRLLDPKGMISASIGIVIMSGALLIMAEVVRQFGGIEWEEMERGLIGMAAALAILVVAANLMSGALAGAAAMLIMSVAVLALSAALKVMSTLSWDELLVALAALGGVFLVIGLAGLLLAPIIPLLFLLGGAMLLIGAGAALMGVGLMYGALGLVALAGSSAAIGIAIGIVGAAIIEVLPKIGTAIAEALANFLETIADKTPKIIKSMNKIILGMIKGITELIPDIVEAVMKMLDEMLTAIINRLPDIIQMGYDILLAFLKGIADNIGEVVTTTLQIVTEILDAFITKLPDLIQAGYDILLAFLKGIADNIGEVITTTLQIVTEMLTAIAGELPNVLQAGFDVLLAFLDGIKDNIADIVAAGLEITAEIINGVADGIPDIIDSAFNLILEFLNGIADAIEEYLPEILAAGKRIGEELIKAIVSAIGDGISEVMGAIVRVAAAALEALKKAFFTWQPVAPPAAPPADDKPPPEDNTPPPKEKDPPPKEEDPPPNIPEAFVFAVEKVADEAEEVLEEFGDTVQDNLIAVFSAIGDAIDEELDYDPVIRPVLDLDAVTTGITQLDRSLASSSVLAQLSYDDQQTESIVSVPVADGGVSFTQINYSPKALDAPTIYRQTKTQVAQLALRAETS